MQAWLKSVAVFSSVVGMAGFSGSHGGSSHGSEAGGMSRTDHNPARDRQAHLESLQAKIEKVERKLESQNLKPAKRVKLEQKLERLQNEKSRVLDQ